MGLLAVLALLGDAGCPNGTKLLSSHFGDHAPVLSAVACSPSMLLLLFPPKSESALVSL
jgi:hypothetical protein